MGQKSAIVHLTGMIVAFGMLFLMGGVFVAPVHAASYYVDIKNGSDVEGIGTGAEMSPWKTLHFAISKLADGDTLYVQSGVYSTARGEADNYLHITSPVSIIGNGEVIIDGSANGNWSTCFSISEEGYISGVTIRNLIIRNFDTGIDAGNATVSIDSCKIYNNFTGASFSYYSNSSVVNSEIYSNDYVGIQADNSSITIQGCKIFDNGGYGYDGEPMGGISLYRSSAVIRNNHIYASTRPQSYGIYIVNGTGTGDEISNNIISGNYIDGIYIENASPRIEKNILALNVNAIQILGKNGTASPIIQNNLICRSISSLEFTPDRFYNGEYMGFSFEMGINIQTYYTLSSQTVVSPIIRNNTIDGASTAIYIYVSSNAYATANPQILYNSVSNVDPVYTGDLILASGSAVNLIDYNNLYLDPNSSGNPVSQGVPVGTFDTSSQTYTDHNTYIQPNYYDPAKGDYHLHKINLNGDTLIDRLTQTDVTDDLDGTPRPTDGLSDIGCYEYADTDNDGINDQWEFASNGVIDAKQLNMTKFVIDPQNLALSSEAARDSDNDGLFNDAEYALRSNPVNPDTDGDGLSDSDEVSRGTDLFNKDYDKDGLTDGEEVHLTLSDPTKADTDEDDFYDGEEVYYGSDTTNTDPNKSDAPVFSGNRTYYVDAHNESYGDGTMSNPWRSVHDALYRINNYGEDNPDVYYTIYMVPGLYSVESGLEDDTPLAITRPHVTICGGGPQATYIDGVGTGSAETNWLSGIQIKAADVTVSNLAVQNFSGNGIEMGGGYGKIESCTSYYNGSGISISSSSHGNTIQASGIKYNRNTGIYLSGNGNQIDFNNSDDGEYYEGISHNGSDTLGYGVYIASGSEGNTISRNSITSSAYSTANQQRYGIYFKDSGTGNRVTDNTISYHLYSDLNCAGIYIENSNPTIEQNRLYVNSVGILVHGNGADSSPIIRNNEFWKGYGGYTANYGIRIKSGDTSGTGSTYPRIYYNTIYGMSSSGISIEQLNSNTAASAEILYNIISNCVAGISTSGVELLSNPGGIYVDSNNFYASSVNTYLLDGESAGIPSPGWFSSDPKFINSYWGDFKLQSGSPCIDIAPAVSLPPPGVDIDGTTRTDSAGNILHGSSLDIGCHEFVAYFVPYTNFTDRDYDGYPDAEEVLEGTDPDTSSSSPSYPPGAEPYYVDVNQTTAGNGSIAHPWNSIQLALHHIQAYTGEVTGAYTIYVKPGTYSQYTTESSAWCNYYLDITGNDIAIIGVNADGSPDAAGPDDHIIDGIDSYWENAIRIAGSNVTLRNLTIRNQSYSSSNSCVEIGSTETNAVIENTSIENCRIEESGNSGISFTGGDNTSVIGTRILSCGITGNYHGIYLGSSSNVSDTLIQACSIANNEENGIYLDVDCNASGTTIDSCSIYGNKYEGIGISGGSGADIFNCEIFQNGMFGIEINNSSNNIIGKSGYITKIYDNGYLHKAELYYHSSLSIPYLGAGISIWGDTAQDNLIRYTDLYWSGDTSHTQYDGVLYNYVAGYNRLIQSDLHGHPNAAIDIFGCAPEISGNELYDNLKGIYLGGDNGAVTPLIQNNLIHGQDHYYGNGIEVSGAISPAILHNTIDEGNAGVMCALDPAAHADIRYNCITGYTIAGVAWPYQETNPEINYNNIWSGGIEPYPGYNSGDVRFTNNISRDPLYTGTGIGGYRLNDMSPCINVVPASDPAITDPVTVDIAGNIRPKGGGYDLGCYESEVASYSVSLTIAGNGQGTVSSNPTGVECGSACSAMFAAGSTVTLTAVPDAGSVFAGWFDGTGSALAVSGTEDSSFAINENSTITAVFNSFASGSGTIDDPYQIGTAEQLDNVRYYPDSYFALSADIDLIDYVEGFTPIGTSGAPFTGTFSGNGHVIRNLTISRPGENGIGFFGNVEGATIKDVNLEDITVAGSYHVGGLVGYSHSGKIINCQVTGTVSGSSQVGGLVGYYYHGGIVAYYYDDGYGIDDVQIINCRTAGTVYGTDYVGGLVGQISYYAVVASCSSSAVVKGTTYVGGLVGYNDFSEISKSYATGMVTGSGNEVFGIGGLLGYNGGGSVSNCYASGEVTALFGMAVGGLIGGAYGDIADCYASGAVNGYQQVGGLVGYCSGGNVFTCYAIGHVTGTSELGGLVGGSTGLISDSYYDSVTTGQSDTGKGEPRTTVQMQQGYADSTVYTDWDHGIWQFTPGQYPVFSAAQGAAWSWGLNNYGQLGIGSTINQHTPLRVGEDVDWAAADAGYMHTVALKSDASLWAWGWNNSGQVGDGTTTDRRSPTRIGNDTDWAAVIAGYDFTFALKENGSLWAWGYNNIGQLGVGDVDNRNTPTQVGNNFDWVAVSAGNSHAVALKSDGTLWSWGSGSYGKLGNGGTSWRNTPAMVGVDNDWAAVSASGNHTVAIKSDGSLWAWGKNSDGQLGDGTTVDKNIPTKISIGEDTWLAVSTGLYHTVAIKSDGSIWAWGGNAYGQLGNDFYDAIPHPTPVKIGEANDWASVTAGYRHNIARKTNGSLWLWGHNGTGQLGDDTTESKAAPAQTIGDDRDWIAVAAGDAHTVAIKTVGDPDLYYTIAASAGAGGSISPSGTVDVIEGGSQEFIITPNSGYHISDVLVDNQSVGAVGSYTFDNVTGDRTISASFAPDIVTVIYTITASAGANGVISPSGPVAVTSGGSQTFSITPNSGYHISDVLVDNQSVGAVGSYTFDNVTGDRTISATFAPDIITVTCTITASAGANGSINPSGALVVNAGVNKVFRITPNSGYHVSDVLVDNQSVGAVSSYTFYNIKGDHTISASFAPDIVTVTYTITASAGANGTISPSGDVAITEGGSQAFSITPNSGYHISDVLVDNQSVGAVSSYSFTGITANHTIKAVFAKNEVYAVTFTASTGGTVSGNTAQSIAYGGQSTAVTATAGENYVFTGWSGDYTGTENPLLLNFVKSNMQINANFNALPEKPVLTAPAEGALIDTPPGAQSIMVELTAGNYVDTENDAHVQTCWKLWEYNNPAAEPTCSESELTLRQVEVQAGVRYAWQVGFMDAGSGQIRWSDAATFVVGQTVVDTEAPAVTPGNTVSSYRIVSFVQWPEDPSAQAVFGPLMNRAYYRNYRIGTYDPTMNGVGGYKEYPDFEVEPGRAYWFLARDGMSFEIEGVPVATGVDFSVPLYYNTLTTNGWNQIACPNKIEYQWGDILVVEYDENGRIANGPFAVRELATDNPYIVIRIWEWASGVYRSGTPDDFTLKPYNGYWVKARKANVFLVFAPDMQMAWANPGIMLTGWYHRGRELLYDALTVRTVIAENEESPPMPMSGFTDGADAGGGSGCFIDVINQGHAARPFMMMVLLAIAAVGGPAGLLSMVVRRRKGRRL